MNRRRPRTLVEALRAQQVLVGSLVLGAIVALAALAVVSTNGIPGTPAYRVQVDLPSNAPPILEGTEVRVHGQVVGLVGAASRWGGGQTAQLRLKRAVEPVHRNAAVTVRSRSAAGGSYLALDRGDAGAGDLPSGARLGVRSVRVQPDLLSVTAGFGRAARRNLQTSMRFTGSALAGRGPQINAALDQAGTTASQATAQIAALNHGQIGPLLAAAQVATDAFSGRNPGDAGAALDTAAAVTSEVGGGAPAIRSVLRRLPPLEDSAIAVLPRLDTTLSKAGRLAERLTPGVAALRDALPDLNRLFGEGATLDTHSRSIASAVRPALGQLRRLWPVLEPPARMVDAALAQLGPFAAHVGRHPEEIVGVFDVFDAARFYQMDGGGAYGPATPAMLVLTCMPDRAVSEQPPGQVFKNRSTRKC